MNILSIGNSFSQDAQRYLHEIAKANGEELTTVNLYIGGCSLKTHYLNILEREKAYIYEFNGEYTGLKVSIQEVLKSRDWDYVTLQQVSAAAFDMDSFFPYIEEVKKVVKKYAPKAKIYLHQTWGYPEEMARLKEVGYDSTEKMLMDIKKTYEAVAEKIEADGVILSGEAMLRAYPSVREKLYRDALHVSLGLGRYLLGIVWFHTFYGEKADFKHIEQFDVPVTEEEKKLAYESARLKEN